MTGPPGQLIISFDVRFVALLLLCNAECSYSISVESFTREPLRLVVQWYRELIIQQSTKLV